MYKIVFAEELKASGNNVEIHVIHVDNSIWSRLINAKSNTPICHWRTSTSDQDNTKQLLDKVRSAIGEASPLADLKDRVEVFTDDWETWTFGTPAPLVDVLDDPDYANQINSVKS